MAQRYVGCYRSLIRLAPSRGPYPQVWELLARGQSNDAARLLADLLQGRLHLCRLHWPKTVTDALPQRANVHLHLYSKVVLPEYVAKVASEMAKTHFSGP
jgi:hypothetical protein